MYKLAGEIVIKKKDGIYMGLNLDNGCTYEMNDTEKEILEFFKDGPRTMDDLINYLCKTYCTSKEEIYDDVLFNIDFLLKENVLEEIS